MPAQAGDGQDGGTRSVVVYAPRAGSVRVVDEALAPCGLTPRRVTDGSALALLRRSEDCGVAVVAVDEDPGPASPLLHTVAVLRGKGYTVLCYWDGPGKWAMGGQCRLLLAGASQLLDGTDRSFAADLGQRLRRLVSVEDARQLEHRRIRRQMLDLGVVGEGPAITSVFGWVLRASPLSDLPVLITGETGTGKELVARAIHRLDPRRREGPFLPVNAGAISAGLAESELFGHRRGAFTGADHDRKGLFRAASGGVLFLDEIGDLDGHLQGKLLRVLQEHQVLALGADQEVPVDVRVIAATNRDLEDMVRRRAFRADLFHRLNVLSVRIPGLRERPEDIGPLVRHFVSRCTEPAPEADVAVSQEFVQALQRVDLPGNVRQLESIVRRALVGYKAGDPLRLSDLPPELWLQLAHEAGADLVQEGQGEAPARAPGAARESAGPRLVDAVAVLEASSWKLRRALDLCEQRMVVAALGVSRGNRSHAARLLGISPRSIFNKMRKHHLAS